MASHKQLVLLSLLAVWTISASDALRYLWGKNEDLNAQCPDGEGSSERPVPDPCDITSFIMCHDGLAIAQTECAGEERFNTETNECDFPYNVPEPEGCEDKDTKNFVPKKCGRAGIGSVGLQDTCRQYVRCTSGGEHVMPCSPWAYYIEEEGYCMYTIEPYVNSIPKDALARCIELDPWTEEELKNSE